MKRINSRVLDKKAVAFPGFGTLIVVSF